MSLTIDFQNRNGFALPVALLAMMVIGAIVTGGFYASSQENRTSLSTDLGSQAFYVAEYGLDEALGRWKNDVLNAVINEETRDSVVVSSAGQTLGTYQLTIRRIGVQLFLITSEGRVQSGPSEAVRRVGTMVRTLQPEMPVPTALAVYGGLTVGGSSQIRGEDAAGPGCAAGADVAGVTAFDSTLVDEGTKDHISGSPPVAEDTRLDTAFMNEFGGLELADLIASATKIYEAGESENGMAPVLKLDTTTGMEICDTSVRSNWGDPSAIGPCAHELPIIYAKGDLHLKTGEGQGILIVEGNLKASGNFDFYGVVVVLGELYTTGTGNHMEGSVIVQGEGLLDSESTTLGNSLVQYSSCRVKRAFDGVLRPRPLAKRSWLDFSASARALTTVY